MVFILNRTTDIPFLKELLAARKPAKKFDAKRFNGALKINEDGLAVQRRLRDEWQ